MDKNKQIQKLPRYSIDRIGAKSELATRGLRALGLLKGKKHFTIIYICQFCGRLINYSSTPCIFCGNFPKTKREVLTAQAISSESLELPELLTVSKSVKNNEDLELTISNLRSLIDETLKSNEVSSGHQSLYNIAEMMVKSKDEMTEKVETRLKRSRIKCKRCGQEILIAHKPCLYCSINAKKGIINPDEVINELTNTQKWIVALNSFLQFIENYLDIIENDEAEEAMEELIFVSVYLISRLIEKEQLPDKNLKNYWKELVQKANYFGSYKLKCAYKINGQQLGVEKEQGQTDQDSLKTIITAGNLSYLLKA